MAGLKVMYVLNSFVGLRLESQCYFLARLK